MPKIVELHRAESTRSIHLYKTFVCFFGGGNFKTKTNDFELVHLLTIACAVFKSKMTIFGKARQSYTVKLRVYSDSIYIIHDNLCIHYSIISGHFVANCMFIFHKTVVQTVILRCLRV